MILSNVDNFQVFLNDIVHNFLRLLTLNPFVKAVIWTHETWFYWAPVGIKFQNLCWFCIGWSVRTLSLRLVLVELHEFCVILYKSITWTQALIILLLDLTGTCEALWQRILWKRCSTRTERHLGWKCGNRCLSYLSISLHRFERDLWQHFRCYFERITLCWVFLWIFLSISAHWNLLLTDCFVVAGNLFIFRW